MYKITAEDLDLIYFTANDETETVGALGRFNMGVSPFMREYLPLMKNVRMVAYRHPFGVVDVLYLYWSRDEDLLDLDRRIVSGSFSDADFQVSVLTFYQAHWCVYCKSTWDALVACGTDFYFGHQDLYRRKMAGEWHRVKTCPKCKSWLREIVVDIFGPSEAGAARG